MIATAVKFQISKIRANIVTFFVLVMVGVAVLYIGYLHSSVIQSITYLFAMWLCSFIIDLFALAKPATDSFPVRKPARESLYILICIALFCLFGFLRFSGGWENMQGITRLLAASLLVFVYPIALAIIMFLLKYNIKDLGLRVQGLIIAVPIIAITALAAYISSPHVPTWNELVTEEGGVLNVLFAGFIAAALSEEFFRLVVQTRLGALLKNVGFGWLIATIIWGFMHVPAAYGFSKDKNMTEAVIEAIRIIPLGLMWGYLTHRTKSILPSVLAHGTNIWGLQNF